MEWRLLGIEMFSRTQALVLGFIARAWASLLVILVVSPEIYDQALRLPSSEGRAAWDRPLLHRDDLASDPARWPAWRWCEECERERFQASVLEYRAAGRDLSEVLAILVTESPAFCGSGEHARRPDDWTC